VILIPIINGSSSESSVAFCEVYCLMTRCSFYDSRILTVMLGH